MCPLHIFSPLDIIEIERIRNVLSKTIVIHWHLLTYWITYTLLLQIAHYYVWLHLSCYNYVIDCWLLTNLCFIVASAIANNTNTVQDKNVGKP